MKNMKNQWAIDQAMKVWIEVLSKYHQGFDEDVFAARIQRIATIILNVEKKLSKRK